MQIAATIETLRARLAGTTTTLASLREKRRPVALKAALGDQAARKTISELDAKEAAVNSEHITAGFALEEAERLAEEERRTAAEAERQRRVAAGAEAAVEMLNVAALIDTKATEIAHLLTRRRELAEIVRRAQVLPTGLVNRFLHRDPVDRALFFAGLQDFASIPRGAAHIRAPLAAADGILLGKLAAGVKTKEKAQ